jgi:hypothetical protein
MNETEILNSIEYEMCQRIEGAENMIDALKDNKDDFWIGQMTNAEFEVMFLKRMVNFINQKEVYNIEYFKLI